MGERAFGSACLAALVLLLPGATVARASDRVYWGNLGGGPSGSLAFASLDGGGEGTLPVPGAGLGGPEGIALDPAHGTIYWANQTASSISYAKLDGSGGGVLNTSGATVAHPRGVAIDPAAGRIYWANSFADSISFARLDNTGGGEQLNLGAASAHAPRGLAIDPAAGRIYWANNGIPNGIAFARLDGSGGANLNPGVGPLSDPQGVAVDAAAGRIYWANETAAISYANLDGSGGGGILNTGTATVASPEGVAIDPAAGRIYWANNTAPAGISFANLDNSGGGDLQAPGATFASPGYPTLLATPRPAAGPNITGASNPGAVLGCSQGAWAGDVLPALYYQAPASFAFSWAMNGSDVGGASDSTFTAGSVGIYTCRVTARNEAGSGLQTSAALGVFKLGKPKLNRARGTATLPVQLPAAGLLTMTGKGIAKQRGAPLQGRLARTVNSAGTVKLKVKPKGRTKKKLRKRGKAKVKPTITFTPTGGVQGSQVKPVKLKLTR